MIVVAKGQLKKQATGGGGDRYSFTLHMSEVGVVGQMDAYIPQFLSREPNGLAKKSIYMTLSDEEPTE